MHLQFTLKVEYHSITVLLDKSLDFSYKANFFFWKKKKKYLESKFQHFIAVVLLLFLYVHTVFFCLKLTVLQDLEVSSIQETLYFVLNAKSMG